MCVCVWDCVVCPKLRVCVALVRVHVCVCCACVCGVCVRLRLADAQWQERTREMGSKGKYTRFALCKENKDTTDAVSVLCQKLRCVKCVVCMCGSTCVCVCVWCAC